MRNLLLIFIICFSTSNIKAQIFNTSKILSTGSGSIGFQPSVFFTNSDDAEFILFLHAGVGVGSNIDLAAKAGLFGGRTFWAVDAEYGLSKNFSCTFGVHNYYNFGLDANINITVPISSKANFITGLDSDINFYNNQTSIPVWLPLALEFKLAYNWKLMLESEIRLTKIGGYFVGAGLAVDF